jgi:superfamily II DNA or RNA helicase
VLKKKTIIFVHKTFLKNQWIERIQQYLPNARIGSIQGQNIDIENKDIVLAMIQSVSMKTYNDTLFDSFGLSIYDECHHMSSEVFCNCLKKCNTLYGLGLSATMNRKDGLTNVFKMYLGDICYKHSKKGNEDDVLVKAIEFTIDDDEYNEVERDFRGQVKYSTMVNKVSTLNMRSDFIVYVLESELFINPKQQFIVLAQTKSLLNYLYRAIVYKNFASVGYYIGGMKESELKKSESKTIILATFSMAAEALDIKSLTSLLLASPKSDIVQAVGRILREKHSNPLVIDIIDGHDVFQNQFNKRRAFYNQKNYRIFRTSNKNYEHYVKYMRSLTTTTTSTTTTLLNIENELFDVDKDSSTTTTSAMDNLQNLWNYLLTKKNKNANANANKNAKNAENAENENAEISEYKCLIKL